MQPLPVCLVVVLLSCPCGAWAGAPVSELIRQLGSESFSRREEASHALEKIGTPALAALRQIETSASDLEVRRRVTALVRRIEEVEAAAQVLVPRRVQFCFDRTPLASAVQEVQRHTGLQVVLPDDETQVQRVVTVDTGTLPLWQAWEAFCRQAGLADVPAVHPRLRLTATREAGPPSDGRGPFRVRLWPADQGPAFRVVIQAEPGLQVVGFDDLRITALTGPGAANAPIQVQAEMSMPPAATATPAPGASWAGLLTVQQPPLPRGGKLSEVRGEFRARVQVPRTLAAIDAVVQAAGKEAAGTAGVRLKVLGLRLADDGDLHLQLRLDGLDRLPPAAEKVIRVRPGVVALRGPADMARDLLELRDAQGRKVPLTDATSETLPGGQTALFQLTYQPRPGTEQELRLVLAERRVIGVTVPFSVKDVPLP